MKPLEWLYHTKGTSMAHQNEAVQGSALSPAETRALIDAEVEAALAEHGITIPAPVKPSALDALNELVDHTAGDVEHSTFAEHLATLAERGYQAAVTAEQESPTLKTLVTIVGELVAKVG